MKRIAFLLSLSLLAVAQPASAATTIGSSLLASANSNVCGFGGFPSDDFNCTEVQTVSLASHQATGGLAVPQDGVLVRWRIKFAAVAPDTKEIKVAPRLLHGDVGGAKGTSISLPLPNPGIYTYEDRMPVKAGDSVGVDVSISNLTTGSSNAPIVHNETGVGSINQWHSVLTAGATDPSNKSSSDDNELLVNADIEPDADHDGFGDETQDKCPTLAATQATCASITPPTASTSYASRQDILKQKSIIVSVNSNVPGIASGSGNLTVPKTSKTYALTGASAAVAPGLKAKLKLKLPKKALKAARKALRKGKKVRATVTIQVKDGAGNASAATKITVTAKKPKKKRR